MTAAQIRGELRRLLGVRANEVPDRELDSFLIPALDWLASELKFDIVTDENIGITAGQADVSLPSDFMVMLWVEWNGNRLTTDSVTDFDRTGNWRTATSGVPSLWGIQGRTLVLNPPPDAASVTTDATLSWRYMGCGQRLTEAGVPGLSDSDLLLVRYDSAIGWLSAHPTSENQAKIQAFTAQIARRLPAAKRRWENATLRYHPTIRPLTTDRFGGARRWVPISLESQRHFRYNMRREDLTHGPI